VNFLPAVSKDAITAMGREIRSWHIARRSDKSLEDLARMFNPIVQGWINYCVSRGHARWDRRAVGSMI
jgi:RNA-directed DNA polymerase